MKFGYTASASDDWETLLDLATHVATTGWDGIWFPDHLMAPVSWFEKPSDYEAEPWNECWTTIAALAAAVPRITLGTIVTCNTLRHPAVVAKMAATAERVSGGRLILGLGAGYLEAEHLAFGIPFPSAGERLRMLAEACTVIRSLFANERTTHEGRHYRLRDAPLEPKPIQKRLPILLAATGERLALRIVAEHADMWNMPGRAEVVAPKLRILDRHCRELGRDPREIVRTASVVVNLADRAEPAEGWPWPAEWTVSGSAHAVKEELRRYVDLGIDVLIVRVGAGTTVDSTKDRLDRFMTDVARHLR